jgi:hypothetical protein
MFTSHLPLGLANQVTGNVIERTNVAKNYLSGYQTLRKTMFRDFESLAKYYLFGFFCQRSQYVVVLISKRSGLGESEDSPPKKRFPPQKNFLNFKEPA